MNLSFPILVSLLLHLAQAGWQANPQTVRDTAARQAGFNYEEVRVPAYTLPDLLPGGGATIRTPDDWRKTFYYHFYEDKDGDHHVAKHEGVTNGKAKLINFYTLGEWELYDLEKDPHELVSVYGKPEYAAVQTELTAELGRLRKQLDLPPNAK